MLTELVLPDGRTLGEFAREHKLDIQNQRIEELLDVWRERGELAVFKQAPELEELSNRILEFLESCEGEQVVHIWHHESQLWILFDEKSNRAVLVRGGNMGRPEQGR